MSQNGLLLITFPINVTVHCRRLMHTNSLLYRVYTRSLTSNPNEEEKQWIHQGNVWKSSYIFSMASAGNMVQENEDRENENEPRKTRKRAETAVGPGDWELCWAMWSVRGLLWWLSGKECASNTGDTGNVSSIPGWGRSLGEGNVNPLRYSCLGNPTERGAWRASVHGVAKS